MSSTLHAPDPALAVLTRRPPMRAAKRERRHVRPLLEWTGGRDRALPDLRFNWMSPWAPAVCCIVVLAAPCLLAWIGAVRIMRQRDRRMALRHNDEIRRKLK